MSLNSNVTVPVPSGNSPTPRLLPQIPVSYDLQGLKFWGLCLVGDGRRARVIGVGCWLGRWRLGRTRATGRIGGRVDLVQPAQRAQHVRPCVSTLLVLPREVRRASN